MPDRSTADEEQPALQNAQSSAESESTAHFDEDDRDFDETKEDRDTEPSIDLQILREALRAGVK